MSESNIKVSSNDVLASLNSFQTEIDKMSTLLDDITKKTSEMPGFWKGNDSEEVVTKMTEFTSTFESITEKNKKYTTFLSNTIEKYSALDKAISKATEGSAGLRINGS